MTTGQFATCPLGRFPAMKQALLKSIIALVGAFLALVFVALCVFSGLSMPISAAEFKNHENVSLSEETTP